MTPKEKAFELVTKYSRILPMNQTTLLDRKNCASIAVDEVLYEFDHLAWHDDDYADYKMKYWKEVKKEIDQL